MKKNFCNACQHNFATEGMFMQHRTGAYSTGKPKQPVGASPRRCLTAQEMQKKGWLLHTLDVDVALEGIATKQPMPTWVLPGQLEARAAIGERLNKGRRLTPTENVT